MRRRSSQARGRPHRRRWTLAGVAATALLLGACGSASPTGSVVQKPLTVLPKGAEIVHPSPPAPNQNCNATASLPPPAVMPTPGRMPQGTYMAQIQARGYLKVGVAQNTYLWGYRDPETGTLSGFDIDMLRQVSEALFGSSDPNDIRFTIVPNVDRVQAVEDASVDLVAETMTINCDREKSVDFSSVYYQAGQRILVPSNSTIAGPQDLGGKRVCALKGSTSLQNLVAAGMPRSIQLWGVDDQTDCLVMLQQGQVDAISTDDAILLGLQAQDHLNTKVVGATFSSEPYGLALSKAHPEFTSFVNGVLAQVRENGIWTQIYDTYLAPHTDNPVPAPPAASYR
jgi:polar amino acid transport system substrate-binding protein